MAAGWRVQLQNGPALFLDEAKAIQYAGAHGGIVEALVYAADLARALHRIAVLEAELGAQRRENLRDPDWPNALRTDWPG